MAASDKYPVKLNGGFATYLITLCLNRNIKTSPENEQEKQVFLWTSRKAFFNFAVVGSLTEKLIATYRFLLARPRHANIRNEAQNYFRVISSLILVLKFA